MLMTLFFNKYADLNIVCALIENIKVEKSVPPRYYEIKNNIPKKFSLQTIVNNEIIRAYRDFFWKIGIDPTKERPSSEALIRRILRGKDIYRINNVVDSMNIVSAYTGIVMSAFDADKILLPITLKAASGGEELRIIGGKIMAVPENFPILVDANGRVFSATIYRDGEETKVTEKTTRIILIAYAPKTIPKSYLIQSHKMAIDIVCESAYGHLKERQI